MRIRLSVLITVLFSQLACSQTPAVAAEEADYELVYSARLVPELAAADVTIEVIQTGGVLRLLDFNMPSARYAEFRGDGGIRHEDERLLWQVPPEGGQLHFRVQINELRGTRYDALITANWAILRLDDLFPAVRVRSAADSRSSASLMLHGPDGWSFVSGYGRIEAPTPVKKRKRRFVRPVGWLAAGDLGVRRDFIGEREFVIAAPVGQSFRRLDMLSFLNWTVPELVAVFPTLPNHVLVVGGGQNMWRGALSGPSSLYMHPDRPLISENATSTLLHELVHVATPAPSADGDDWIAEGLAEYYSLTILRRSGGISEQRYQAALTRLQAWSDREQGSLTDPSKGADTAYALLMFAALDDELQRAGSSLDKIVGDFFAGGLIDRVQLSRLVESALGKPSDVLARAFSESGAG